MATRDISTWEGWCTSHLNIVLLGGRNSGKSSVGNIILCKEEFVTKERTTCSRRLGLVAGRWVSVVDTPGWWCDFSSQDTAELVKREIVSSVSLCLPGPHVFLIVVKASSVFSGQRQRALEEHLALLSERVWSHSVVVFTCVDWPERVTVEQHIQRGGKALQWLSEKCSQRCHYVTLRSDFVGRQVTELLVKIQRLVTENGNRSFEMEQSILQDIAEKKQTVEKRAQQRLMKIKTQRSLLQEKVHQLSDTRIVLLGARGSGKSTAGNTILGREGSLDVGRRTAQSTMKTGSVFGRHVTVVDTPGWWMNYFTKESPIFDQREIVRSLSLCPPGPHALLLVVRVDRAFTETYRRAVQEHLELIGEHIWTHVLVLFTFGDWLGDATIERYIESEGEPLRWLVDKCENRYHVLNNKTKGNGFQVRELMGKIEETVAANSCCHYEIERNVMQRLEEKLRTEEGKAKERLTMKKIQRQTARVQLEKLNSLSEVRVALVGGRNTGKSSTGNTILGREMFEAESQPACCVEKQGQVSGKTVTVLDTPGWRAVNPELLIAPSACGLTAVLLVVNVSCSFTQSLLEATERQMEGLGEKVWNRTMVLFTYGDWLGETNIEQRIESEGDPLQKLVERCGNRYHVLDNTNWSDGAQVTELLEQIEEMLVEERLEMLQRGHQIGTNIAVTHELQPDGVTQLRGELQVFTSYRDEPSHDMFEVASFANIPSLDCSEGPDVYDEVVALPRAPGGRTAAGLTVLDRQQLLSRVASMLHGKEGLQWGMAGRKTLVLNLPVWLSADYPRGPRLNGKSHVDPHGLRLNGKSHVDPHEPRLNGKSHVDPFSHRHQPMVLLQPAEQSQTQTRMLMQKEEGDEDMHSLCHPRMRERTLKKLTKTGGLQALIDQWGSSDLEELEAFIDSYFEMVWEEAMGSETAEQDCPTTDVPEQDSTVDGPGLEVLLSSIDKKLSKLDLLEEIQRDLAELRHSLERSCKTIQELTDKRKGEQDFIKPAEAGEST